MRKFVLFLSTLFLLTFTSDVGATSQKSNQFSKIEIVYSGDYVADVSSVCVKQYVENFQKSFPNEQSFVVNEQRQKLNELLFTSFQKRETDYKVVAIIENQKNLPRGIIYNKQNIPLHRFQREQINISDHC